MIALKTSPLLFGHEIILVFHLFLLFHEIILVFHLFLLFHVNSMTYDLYRQFNFQKVLHIIYYLLLLLCLCQLSMGKKLEFSVFL